MDPTPSDDINPLGDELDELFRDHLSVENNPHFLSKFTSVRHSVATSRHHSRGSSPKPDNFLKMSRNIRHGIKTETHPVQRMLSDNSVLSPPSSMSLRSHHSPRRRGRIDHKTPIIVEDKGSELIVDFDTISNRAESRLGSSVSRSLNPEYLISMTSSNQTGETPTNSTSMPDLYYKLKEHGNLFDEITFPPIKITEADDQTDNSSGQRINRRLGKIQGKNEFQQYRRGE